MSHYEIYVTCTECAGEHPMGIRINLEDGPSNKQSVSDAYYGKLRPPQLQALEWAQRPLPQKRKNIHSDGPRCCVLGASRHDE
jgi:hypothetical protein